MRKINKKARILELGLFIILLMSLTRIFFLGISRSSEISNSMPIGSNQLSFFMSMQEAEKAMLYGEQGFGMAFQKSIYETALSGGYAKTPICGKSGSYTIWRKDNNTECYPSTQTIKQSLSEYMAKNMEEYTANNPYNKEPGTQPDYELFFEQEGEFLIARAYPLSPSSEGIRCNYAYPPESGGKCGNYYYRPLFSRKSSFSIDEFSAISQEAKKIAENVNSCAGITASCMTSELNRLNSESRFNWGLCEVAGIATTDFAVCVSTGKNALVYDSASNEMALKGATVKFMLSFP